MNRHRSELPRTYQLKYKGKNLLNYEGSRSDFEGFGRQLSRCMLTLEEREKVCWFPLRSNANIMNRMPADPEAEKYFEGLVLRTSIFDKVFVSRKTL